MTHRGRRAALAALFGPALVAPGLVAPALVAPALVAPARAQQGAVPARPDPNPDGSVVIEQIRVGILAVGAAVGGGRLRFRGEEYSFSVRGLEFGSVGVTTLSASGEVFHLRRLEDFPGRYEERVEPTPPGGEGGPETRVLRNAAGVELRLRTDRTGGQWRIGEAGVTIELRS